LTQFEGFELTELTETKAKCRYGKIPTESKLVIPSECSKLDDATKAVIGMIPFLYFSLVSINVIFHSDKFIKPDAQLSTEEKQAMLLAFRSRTVTEQAVEQPRKRKKISLGTDRTTTLLFIKRGLFAKKL
jgi:hypothetical protein